MFLFVLSRTEEYPPLLALMMRTLNIKFQMNYISSKIRELASELVKDRRYNYCEDTLLTYLEQHPTLKMQRPLIKNKRGENLDTIIIKPPSNPFSDTCIIYAHGLGSNKIQVLPIVDVVLKSDCHFHVCAFDFSGSGRSDGQHTTYGLREQDDINAILAWLDVSRQYSRYVLWGRSMGGASIILSQSRNINKKVQCIILDSPFSSFEKAAIEVASRSTSIPQIMINLVLDPVKQVMSKEYKHLNPFDLDICGAVSKIQTKVMLIYSKDDSIVNFSHSKEIGRHCQKNAVEIQIDEDHNKPRKKQTFKQALKFIIQSMQMHASKARRSSSKGRGISVSSKQNFPSNYKPRTSIVSSINSEKCNKFNQTENIQSIGSFISSSSYELDTRNPKQATYIKSILQLDHNNNTRQHAHLNLEPTSRDAIRNSIKYGNNKYRNCTRLL